MYTQTSLLQLGTSKSPQSSTVPVPSTSPPLSRFSIISPTILQSITSLHTGLKANQTWVPPSYRNVRELSLPFRYLPRPVRRRFAHIPFDNEYLYNQTWVAICALLSEMTNLKELKVGLSQHIMEIKDRRIQCRKRGKNCVLGPLADAVRKLGGNVRVEVEADWLFDAFDHLADGREGVKGAFLMREVRRYVRHEPEEC